LASKTRNIALSYVIDIFTDDYFVLSPFTINVARGYSGCTCTPRVENKILGAIYRENL